MSERIANDTISFVVGKHLRSLKFATNEDEEEDEGAAWKKLLMK